MGDKIAIGRIARGRQRDSARRIAIGIIVKDAESGAEQEHGDHGHFASDGGNVIPHGKDQISVAGDKIQIGDVIHHGNPKLDGGKVIQITPAPAGKEERGPRIKLQFKNGDKPSNYFKPSVKYVVTRGTQAEAKTQPAVAAKPNGAGKPQAGAGKKPAAGQVDENAALQPKLNANPKAIDASEVKVGQIIALSGKDGAAKFEVTGRLLNSQGDVVVSMRNIDTGKEYGSQILPSGVRLMGQMEKPLIDPGKMSFGDKDYGAQRTYEAGKLEVGYLVHGGMNMPLGVTGVIEGIKPVPGGQRELLVRKDDGSLEKVTVNTKYGILAQPAFNKLPAVGEGTGEHRIALINVVDAEGNKYGMQTTSWSGLQPGALVRLPSTDGAGHWVPTTEGRLIGIKDMGRGRLEYHVLTDDGKLISRQYTAAMRDNAWQNPRQSVPITDDAMWAKYKELAADQQKAAEEAKIAAEKAAAEKAAKEAVETDRRQKEVDAFTSSIKAQADALDATDPAGKYAAGSVKNGGWGMSNADLAAVCEKELSGATLEKIGKHGGIDGFGKGGAINDGKFLVTGSDGTPMFAKMIIDSSPEIGHEVLGALIAQRIGLGSAATLPCYISPNGQTITTNPDEIPPGRSFNGVIMDRARDENGNALPQSHDAGDKAVASSDPEQLQRLALLDALIGNTDRHDGNFFLHPSEGVVAFDAGYGFGQFAGGHGDAGAGQMLGMLWGNNTTPALNILIDTNLQGTGMSTGTKVDSEGHVAVSLTNRQASQVTAVSMLPLMSERQVGADGKTVTFVPTAFAQSLRDQVTAACADFVRSYEDGGRLTMPAVPGGLSANGIGKNNSGIGFGMLAGALNQMLGGAQTAIQSAAIAPNASFVDPSGTFAEMMKLTPAKQASLKISIGKIRKKKKKP